MALELLPIAKMMAREAPLEELDAALDELLAGLGDREDADLLRASIAYTRVSIYSSYRQPPDECAAVLEHYLTIDPNVVQRADAVWLACAQIPSLRKRFLGPQIEELEKAPSNKRVEQRLARLRELRDNPPRPDKASSADGR